MCWLVSRAGTVPSHVATYSDLTTTCQGPTWNWPACISNVPAQSCLYMEQLTVHASSLDVLYQRLSVHLHVSACIKSWACIWCLRASRADCVRIKSWACICVFLRASRTERVCAEGWACICMCLWLSVFASRAERVSACIMSPSVCFVMSLNILSCACIVQCLLVGEQGMSLHVCMHASRLDVKSHVIFWELFAAHAVSRVSRAAMFRTPIVGFGLQEEPTHVSCWKYMKLIEIV